MNDPPVESPTYEPLEDFGATASEPEQDGPSYQPLGEDAPQGTGYPGDVTPFSDAEVFDGTLQMTLWGYQLAGFRWREGEQEIFTAAFTAPPVSPVPLPVFVSKLGVGEALARYGIGHGMAVGQVMDRAGDLPAWVTLLLYGFISVGASYLGMKQVKHERQIQDLMGGGQPFGAPGPDVGVQEEQYETEQV